MWVPAPSASAKLKLNALILAGSRGGFHRAARSGSAVLCVRGGLRSVTDQLLCSVGDQGEKGPWYQPWMVLLEWGLLRRKNMSCFFSAAFRVIPAGLDVTGSLAGFFGRTVLCDVGPAPFRTGLCAQTKQGA